MWHQHGTGFAVYKADLQYKEGAVFGDLLEIRTRWEKQGDYRLVFYHEAWRPKGNRPAVTCRLELVCIGPERKLLPVTDLDMDS